MNPKAKIAIPAIAALIFIVIDFVAPVQYLSYFHTGLLRNFRPRLRWGLSILSVVGTTSALTTLSLMISTSQAVNFTTLILNIMIVAFLLLAALLALLIWVRAKKEFDQRQADLEEEEVVVAPMPLTTEGAGVAPVVPVTAEAAPAVAAEASEASAAPETPEAPQE